MRVGRRSFVAFLLIALLCAGLFGAAALLRQGHRRQIPEGGPNIVMIIDDDQTAEQQRFLIKTNAQIGRHGVTFDNSLVNFSLCCPSRSTLLTGQYAHNHGVLADGPPSGGYTELAPTLVNTLPVWLQRAGYYTGLIGKFLNHYGATSPESVPPGWNEWYGTVDNAHLSRGGYYAAYGYTLNENGRLVHYGSKPSTVDPAIYQTDVFSRMASEFIRRRAPSDQPFFLYIAPRDPHVEPPSCKCAALAATMPAAASARNNPRAAPRYEGTRSGISAPRNPDFDEADVSDKPSDIRNLPPLTSTQIAGVDARYRAEAEALLGVDDLVQNVVTTLKSEGELANTLIIFTSDNGFFHGEHRVRKAKVRVYEPSIRVPLLIRGPGVPQGVHRRQLVGNVDLAPTILDFAHAKPRRVQDGQSLVPIMRKKRYSPGRGLDLEAHGNPVTDNPPLFFRGVRTDRYVYARYGTGEQELYDLRNDPFELQNAAANATYARVKSSLQRLLGGLAHCTGQACRSSPGLKLRLRGCSSAAVKGKGVAQEATFYLRGQRIGRDGKPPIRIRVPDGSPGEELEAVSTSLDGRIASLKRKLHC